MSDFAQDAYMAQKEADMEGAFTCTGCDTIHNDDEQAFQISLEASDPTGLCKWCLKKLPLAELVYAVFGDDENSEYVIDEIDRREAK